jgi:DNA-binding transcriptional ArsR family regulator
MAEPQIDIDRLFHALGDPTRRAMLDKLSERPQSVSALAAPLGITLTAVVQHLQILEECGLVRTEKVGRVRSCRIHSQGFAVLERWIKEHRTVWEQRLDRLGDLLAEPDEESG